MKQQLQFEALSDLAIAGLLTGRAASSSFWSPPSQEMVWQRFMTSASITYPFHTHPEYNIVICLRGAVEVRQCGEAQVAERGEALIGNAKVAHQSVYLPDQNLCEAVSLTISASFLNETLGNLKPMHAPGALLGKINSPAIEPIALAAREELRRVGERNVALLERLARHLVLAVFEHSRNRAVYDASLLSDGPFLPRWQYVRSHEIMLERANDTFTIHDTARELGLSPGRFHLLFRSSTGLPPADYFGRIVLVKAKRQLRDSEDSVKQISYDLGFSSPSHFCARFRRRYGLSPLDYRQAVQE